MPTELLVVGAGAREHALAVALAASPGQPRVTVIPGNAGMAALGVATADPPDLLAWALDVGVDLAIIGPEAPLVDGLADRLRAAGIPTFGPSAAAAAIEGSKAWARAFCGRHGIPMAPGAVVASVEDGCAAVEAIGLPVFLKADGLAAGKGAFRADTREASRALLHALLEEGLLGAAGRKVIVEAALGGPELSLLALCDGSRYQLLPAARDHKRLQDGDEGPNTGGMGAWAPALDPAAAAALAETFLAPALAGLAAEGRPFVGCLYAGLILDPGGPRLLEFNARFGDPEVVALLGLLERGADLAGALAAAAAGDLPSGPPLRWREGASVAVVLAAPGYPSAPARGAPLSLPAPAEGSLFSAGIGPGLRIAGGRVLCCRGLGPDLAAARAQAYRLVEASHFAGAQWRRDIAVRGAYAAAGVDIEAGQRAVSRIGAALAKARGPAVLSPPGAFAGLFDAAILRAHPDAALVATADGVGTKALLGRVAGRYDTLGADLVHHAINDLLVMGGEPLFLLDTVSMGRLDPAVVGEVVAGIAAACARFGVALLGGETAELPDLLLPEALDLNATLIGYAPAAFRPDPAALQAGDAVLALPSSGLHTNGFSLVRRVLAPIDAARARALLDPPHRPYLDEVRALRAAGIGPRALVHITGGGLVDNPPRVLPPHLSMALDPWDWPPLFVEIAARGGVSTAEMRRVFNLGVGMLVILSPEQIPRAQSLLPDAFPIGRLIPRQPGAEPVIFP